MDHRHRRQGMTVASSKPECENKLLRMLDVETQQRKEIDGSFSLAKCSPNGLWRQKVAQWFYSVVDCLTESREVVYVALNILDRYCALKQTTIDEKIYELASLCAIYIAVRTSGSCELSVEDLISMSRSGAKTNDILMMGKNMVKELTWKNRILTPVDFVKTFFLFISPRHLSKQFIFDETCYFLEIAVSNTELTHAKASNLALAAIINAMHQKAFPEVDEFLRALQDATGICSSSLEIARLRKILNSVCSSSIIEDPSGNNGPHIILPEEDEIQGGIQIVNEFSVKARVASCALQSVVSFEILNQDYGARSGKRQIEGSSNPCKRNRIV